jgi:hypothetical protein
MIRSTNRSRQHPTMGGTQPHSTQDSLMNVSRNTQEVR